MTRVNSKPEKPPTKSFLKIINSTEVKSCVNKRDNNCPIGIHYQSGSGVAINILPGRNTVLTAGHVCDTRPTVAIKEVNQTLHVIDHKANIHQAWPILVSHNNQKGSSDLCLLWVPTLDVEGLNVSFKPPFVGQRVTYMGAPAGVYHPPVVPIFSGTWSGNIDASSALVTVPAMGGSSGSGILNDKNEILGVLWGANARFNHISVMSNHKSFLHFIRSGRKILRENQL